MLSEKNKRNRSSSQEERGVIRAYLKDLNSFTQLKHPEVISLFQTYELGGKDAEIARKKLVESNLRLVIFIAKKHKGHNMPLEDLIQEGNLGLLKAIERFDWKKGFRFSTYATWWIKQAISQHVLKRKRMIRLPAHAAGVQKKLLQATDEFREQMGVDPSDEELMGLVDASEAVVKATMTSGRNVISLDQASGPDSDGASLGDRLEDTDVHSDPFCNVASRELYSIVRNVLSSLTEKESAILRLRFGLFDESLGSCDDYNLNAEDLESLSRGIPLNDSP